MSDRLPESHFHHWCRYLDTTSDYNRNTVIEIECKTADALVTTMKQIDKQCALNLFRGHSNSSWELLPTAHRNDSWVKDFAYCNLDDGCERLGPYRWKNETDDRFHRRVELALRSYFQIQIIVAFEELARDWGILDSCDQAANSKAKSDVYTGFDRLTSYMASDRIPWLRTRNPLSRIRAQHHGINTPMLDFTSSYFVALDFASRGSHECSGSHLAVWAIVDSPPLDFSHPYSVVSTYLQTQRSFMLFNSSADKAFYECGQWIPFETRLSNTMPLGSVFKVTLPFSEVESLVKWLRLTTSPLYMMGTPMYESVLSMQRRVDCLKTKFCDEVRRRVQCQIDWDQVQIDIRHQSQAQAQEATFCETRCNDHCNTMFSTTFK